MNRKETLEAASRTICGDRDRDYGTPEMSFQAIADLWSAYLMDRGAPFGGTTIIHARDVAAMMALFKIARIATGRGKEDNWIDLAGYAACGNEIESRSYLEV